ncbi:magnesium-translocating P-type ATPase [Blastocladiella britannica]|nr:magnesium-translocating P-type ATPase [Blastocladiella britannica]
MNSSTEKLALQEKNHTLDDADAEVAAFRKPSTAAPLVDRIEDAVEAFFARFSFRALFGAQVNLDLRLSTVVDTLELLSSHHSQDHLLSALSLPANHQGLSTAQVETLRSQYGPNKPMQMQPPTLIALILTAILHPFVLLLILLAVVGGSTGDFETLTFLLCMSAVSVVIRVAQDVQSRNRAMELQAMVTATVTVSRIQADDVATTATVPIEDIVPGDVLVLAAGDMFPCDCILLTARDLHVAQAALTGESFPVEKVGLQAMDADAILPPLLERKHLAFGGTSVVSGIGSALVITTGTQTYMAAVAAKLQARQPPNSFERSVRRLTYLLVAFMVVMAPMTILINGLTNKNWAEAALFGLSVAVGLTPEMLPTIVNANLVRGAVAMMKKRTIVKRLDAIQVMGGITVLCTDKTGTLTSDHISISKCINARGEDCEQALKYAYLNAKLQTGMRSLLDAAIIAKATDPEHAAVQAAADEWAKVAEIPFDFQRRRLTIVAERSASTTNMDAADGDSRLMVTKGAVEELLARCTSLLPSATSTTPVPLAAEMVGNLSTTAREMNDRGLRVLAVAIKSTTKPASDISVADECALTFVGFLAFLDPPKDDAALAISQLTGLYVSIKVLTGDNLPVTLSVCSEVGIPTDHVYTGEELAAMTSDTEYAAAVRRGTIFAKLSPFQKASIVQELQAQGESVGFLGDGINDALAIKQADVGISVDTGMAVAKEAADVILLEKSLLLLSDAVVKGRRTCGNTLKYIKMTMSSNFGTVFSVLVAAAWLPYLPMTPLQLLVQNMMYDLSCVSLPWDTMDPEYLEKPRQWIASDIARFMVFVGPWSCIFDFVTFAVNQLYFKTVTADDISRAQTMWFVESILTHMLIINVLRTALVPFVQTRASNAVLATTGVMAMIAIYLPFSPVAPALSMLPWPVMFLPFLVLSLVGYVFLVQVTKVFYIRKFHTWL